MLGALTLVLVGSALHVAVAVILGVVALLLEAVHAIWARHGLRGVSYTRHLATDRTSWGEEIPMRIEVWNRKRLPLPWLRADDAASAGVVVRDRPIVETEEAGDVLRNTWTLAPFERVVRNVRIVAERRGVFTIGPVGLSVGDLFARPAALEERATESRYIVRPRTVRAPSLVRPDRWGDLERAHRGLAEDPARFAGVRPYVAGDPLRRVHQRTSAHLGHPVTKRFEPSHERRVLIALDLQTAPGRAWDLAFNDDDVEALLVVAGSIARSLEADGAAFGLTAAGFTGAATRFADVAISESPGQAGRVLDLLARLSSHPSTAYEVLLARVRRTTRPDTTVVALTARDPAPFVGPLRALRRAGFGVVLLACGPAAGSDAARARGAGLAARSAVLDGPWRTARSVVMG